MQKKAPLSTTTTTAPPLCLYTLRFLRCLGSGARGRSLKGREGLGLGRYTLQRGGGGGGGGGRGQKFQGKKCIAWQLRPGKKEEGKETMSRYALKVNARLRERDAIPVPPSSFSRVHSSAWHTSPPLVWNILCTPPLAS